MANSQKTSMHPARRERIKRLLLGLVYLLSISGLIVWEYRDHLDALSSACDRADSETKPSLYSVPYRHLLSWATSEGSTQVSVVAIPLDLSDVQNNVCLGRGYLADLVRSVAAQHPAEIVIDKYFGASTCKASPDSTNDLLSVAQSLSVPLVVGEYTPRAREKIHGACLVHAPSLEFRASNVIHGLIRVNLDKEKIPLRWAVLPDELPDAQPKLEDALAWAAVQAYDPTLANGHRLRSVLASGRAPYSKLGVELPRQTSSQLLCDAGTPAMQKQWTVDCSGPRPHNKLLGKIVVIGAESETDVWPVLDGRMWGMDLQAQYIQALISGSYLCQLPDLICFLLFAFFIFLIEGLPTLLEAAMPHWKKHWMIAHAFQRQRYVWVIVCLVSFVALTTMLSVVFGYLPPLAVFGDIVLVVTTRILFFAAESSEKPLVHPIEKGLHESH